MCNFDWHRLKKEIGFNSTVRGLWDRLGPSLENADFTSGFIVRPPGAALAPLSSCETTFERRQKALLRFNCADSLDRTNLCCFIVSQQLLLEQCRRLRRGLLDPALRERVPARIDPEAPWAFLREHELQVSLSRSRSRSVRVSVVCVCVCVFVCVCHTYMYVYITS